MNRAKPSRCYGLLPLITALLWSMPSFAQTGDVQRVHDPRIAECDKAYYIFCTGRGIPIRKSADMLHWEAAGSVFSEVPAWTKEHVPQGNRIWAPDICFFNGRYCLYYCVSMFGKNLSVIGLATNKTLDPNSKEYHWEDQGKVLQSTPQVDDFNAIDPAVCFDEKGQPWLTWGSFWSGIKLQQLDPNTGKLQADSKMFPIARRPPPDAIEAPYIIKHGGHFYLFASYDFCCRGINSTYNIKVGRGKSITGPYVDRNGKALLEDGGTIVVESRANVRGPGHNGVITTHDKDYLIHHFYDANNFGVPALQIREIIWTEDQWPTAPEAIDQIKKPAATTQP